jgi:DtxR family Mn-dependent transcriptional regulator
MVEHSPTHTSESEEMYLITVARATEDGHATPIPVSLIAGSLHVSVASANEMIRKLAARGLVTYEPYRGVALTPIGDDVATRVLRTRRLWATFLADHLGFSPTEADDQACELEHVTTPGAADRLADFLGDPETGPLGHPIPRHAARQSEVATLALADAPAGAVVETMSTNAAGAVRAFLDAEGVVPGARLTVVATGHSGVVVALGDTSVHLTHDVAAAVAVRLITTP